MINRLETKLRKGAAAILAFCVASTSCMGNAFAAVREAEEDDEIELVECVIDLDKKRRIHYETFTNQKWGRRENYDIMLNSGQLGIETCVQILCDAVK